MANLDVTHVQASVALAAGSTICPMLIQAGLTASATLSTWRNKPGIVQSED